MAIGKRLAKLIGLTLTTLVAGATAASADPISMALLSIAGITGTAASVLTPILTTPVAGGAWVQ